MIDVQFEQGSYGKFDLVIEDGQLKNIEGFDTAIWVSLFTDARATKEQVHLPKNRRGWLGDIVSETPDRKIGSYLWLLEQRRITNNNLNNAKDWARKALQWLIDDGRCSEIKVDGALVPKYGIELTIDIYTDLGVISTTNIKLWEVTGTE